VGTNETRPPVIRMLPALLILLAAQGFLDPFYLISNKLITSN